MAIGQKVQDDSSSRRRQLLSALWSILAALVLAAIFIFIYKHPSRQWQDVGAAATAAAALIAGSGLVFIARQSRDSARSADASMRAARVAEEAARAAQQQFIDHMESMRKQRTTLMFDEITLGPTLVARNRLSESLRDKRVELKRILKLVDLSSENRDDLFVLMRQFQRAAMMCIPSISDVAEYIDSDMAVTLMGWDIAWWSGALTGAFGNSLRQTGLQKPWEALEQLREWAESKDGSLVTIYKIALQWIQSN